MSGRRLPTTGLTTAFDTKLDAPRVTRPRMAARRPRLPVSASPAATPIQSRPWFADMLR